MCLLRLCGLFSVKTLLACESSKYKYKRRFNACLAMAAAYGRSGGAATHASGGWLAWRKHIRRKWRLPGLFINGGGSMLVSTKRVAATQPVV